MAKETKQKVKQETEKVIVLLDTHAILHRAFHALPPTFTSPSGEPTGAVYGLSTFLIKVIRELKPDHIIACYDLPEPTFRHIAYEDYKGKRAKMDDTLVPQINRSHEIMEAFDIPVYSAPGFEADDMLGTIVEQLPKKLKPKTYKLIIASGDLDTLQLVKDDEVVVFTPSRGIQEAVIYNEEKVIERFGFVPKLLPDFKGLKGDPSDNIIGVPGIGDKTATTLITNFGTIENLYKILKKDKSKFEKIGIKPRIIKILEENEEEALFSKTLAEIRRDAPIEFSLPKESNGKQENLNLEKIRPLFQELGFKSLIDRVQTSLF
jgi:DNA polymerase-1